MIASVRRLLSTFNIQHSTFPVTLYALLALLVIPVFPHFPSPNEFSRWALAASIVERQSIEVTWLAPLLGANEDLAEVDGRLYSNKAPGAALVGLPGYAIARAIVGPPSAATMRPTLTAMRLLAATLPALLLAMLLGGRAAPALLFGTPLFAYGLLNFSHALAAFALFAAWVLLFKGREFTAGALIGLAVLSEYPCAVAAIVLVAFAWRRAWRVVAGGVPFALVLALYNRAAFGSVFALSSGHERYAPFQELASQGWFGIGVPNPLTLLKLLLDPARGLLVFSPIVIVAIAALPRARKAMSAPQFWSLVSVPIALLLVYAGYPNWHGGWTVGARYLVPALPFLLYPLRFREPSRVESLALGASVLACTVTTLAFPFVPPDFPLPWRTFALPLMAQGLVAPNLLHLVWRPLARIVPFALVALAARGRWVWIGAAAMLLLGFAASVTPRMRAERAYILRMVMAPRTQPPPDWPF